METRTFTLTFDGVTPEQADAAVAQLKKYAETVQSDIQEQVTSKFLAENQPPTVDLQVEVSE